MQFVYPQPDSLPRLLGKNVGNRIALMGECCCYICGISWMPQLIFPVPQGILGPAVCPFNVHWKTEWYLEGSDIKPDDHCECNPYLPSEKMYYFLSAIGWGLSDLYYLCDLRGILEPDQQFFLRFNKYAGKPDPPTNDWFILSGVPYWDEEKHCYHIFQFEYDTIEPQPQDAPGVIAHQVRFSGDGVLSVREEAYNADGVLVGWGTYQYQKPELQELECGGIDTSSSQVILPGDSDSSSSSQDSSGDSESSSSHSEESDSSSSSSSESSSSEESSSSSESSSSEESDSSSSSSSESSESSDSSSSSSSSSSSPEEFQPGFYVIKCLIYPTSYWGTGRCEDYECLGCSYIADYLSSEPVPGCYDVDYVNRCCDIDGDNRMAITEVISGPHGDYDPDCWANCDPDDWECFDACMMAEMDAWMAAYDAIPEGGCECP